jgi:hypothetical protein
MKPFSSFFLITLLSAAAFGQAPKADVETRTLTIRPAAEPVPALRYRLLPERRDLVPGNAAVLYHRAILMLKETEFNTARQDGEASDETNAADWVDLPVAEFPKEKARALIGRFERTFNELDQAALRTSCDWEFENRTEGIALLLPEVQSMRSLARLQALRVRLALVDGDTDGAFERIRTGYVMGRHVAEGPTLIQALVGMALTGQMNRMVEEWIQTPGASNLYWALANRPRPFIAIGPALDAERGLLEKELPRLREVQDHTWSADEARQVGDQLISKIMSMGGGGMNDAPPASGLERAGRRIAMAAGITRFYPEAKKALIAAGRPAEEVEAMPTLQVVLLHALREYETLRDDTYKWAGLPFWQTLGRPGPAIQDGPGMANQNPLVILFRLLVPAIDSARMAEVRSERHFDALQAIEAIRLHAAGHDGALPATLADITDVPVPLDPATNAPFGYRKVDDATAMLELPPLSDLPAFRIYQMRYELKLAR